ncbi:MAG: hypothetical protein ACRC8K_09385 [Waterburya sp.]
MSLYFTSYFCLDAVALRRKPSRSRCIAISYFLFPMPVTPTTLKSLYPWFVPDRGDTEESEYDDAVASADEELQVLIDIYSPFFPSDFYGEFTDLVLGLMVAHHKRLNDQDCLRIATVLKQLEIGKSLSLDDTFLKSCGCDDQFLSKTIFGLQILQIRNEVGGMSMFVV